ncbi:hypothetical protein K32_24580 [Kaistia sp. 32K]|uniref:organic hydroperoxide resistance protein n=1 Tax=Kaistia sp. 32K TaxID=2795690 RepID=UPI00191555F4|nr:organic hydroperoxide resistance protein [Kaistia sp. 32K]BCP53841.1 hypothetical protein K32_24580 [Kaistia sp. 32K]
MKTLYSTKVDVVGGRNGTATSDDGLLALKLAQPVAIGGRGGAPNPEQLFAAGYAGCFGSAVIHVARGRHRISDDQVAVAATVGLVSKDDGQIALTVALDVTIDGVDPETAEAIVAEAHRTCPYSNAVRGNIDVQISVTAR